MSGIYIKGMEMPKSCNECRFFVDAWCYALEVDDWRNAYNKPQEGKRLDGCPLIHVPDHGRLIDGDKLPAEMYRSFVELEDKAEKELGFDEVLRRGMQLCHAVCVNAVHAAPVVIPADPAPRFDYPGPRDGDADLQEEVQNG